MLWAAGLMACRLEPQLRLTVTPATSMGKPAISDAMWATS
jgi:hypothetical protein